MCLKVAKFNALQECVSNQLKLTSPEIVPKSSQIRNSDGLESIQNTVIKHVRSNFFVDVRQVSKSVLAKVIKIWVLTL